MIGDSTFIRDHIEKTYSIDLDVGLTPLQRAQAWTIERMLEDHLYWAEVHERWVDDVNFAKGPATFFDRVPEAMRDAMRSETRERVKATLHAQGMGRHTREEIVDLANRSLGALAMQIGDKPYLMGAKPCGADATAFAVPLGQARHFKLHIGLDGEGAGGGKAESGAEAVERDHG